MNIKHILVLAAGTMLAAFGCKKPVIDLGPEKVEISQNNIEVSKDGGSYTIDLTATVDWQLKDYTENTQAWVNVDPTSGKAAAVAQTITIKVLPNDGAARNATIEFYGNIMASAKLIIKQEGAIAPGEGTKESPYSASEAKAKASELADGDKIENVYVKGKISSIKSVDTGSFGNAEYSISDDGTTNDEFIIYRGYSLGGAKFTKADEIKVGDDVIVLGAIVNFKGNTPEMTTGSKIISLNGVVDEGTGQGGNEGKIGTPAGTGTEEDPYNVAAVITKYNESGISDDKIFVKGKLVEIKALPETKYQSGDFYIADADDEQKLYVYHCKNIGGGTFASADDLKIGDVLVINGRISEYNGVVQIGGPVLISVNGEGGQGGDTPTPTPDPGNDSSFENPWTASQAKAAAAALASGATIENVYVKGIISYVKSIDTDQYGNAEYYISDDGKRTNDFYIFRGYSIDGEKFTSADEIKVSDTVILLGTITNYNGTPEMAQGSKILSLVPGEGGNTEEIPEGSVILSFPDDNADNNGLSTKQYESEWLAKSGDVEFTIFGYNNNKWGNNWKWIKCGRKSDASVATIINKTALPKLSKVVVTVDTIIDKGAEAINKAVLNVYSDAAKTTAVATDIEATDGFMQGDVAFEIPANLQAEGLYYELLIDCKAHGSKNGIVSIAKIVYTAAE